ncbi:MAG: CTP synthase [Candidatus Roizmanbacteria bacterium]|nr:CTP synthase [Candidatus Roizmanbacteria bacterium]
MRYIFVSGGVISGIGKGIVSASVALLLQSAGYRVTIIKCENYLNIDAGTINPIEHGDPFLCEDGTEADMDLGAYESYLNKNVGKNNFITMGQIYRTVIDRERRFEYNGEDVEAIPHITDEIQYRITHAANAEKAEIAVVELGGTAGEYQNIFYYEAARILALRNPKKVIHIHVGYMPTPQHLGEPKTKPIQLSVRTLNSMGIQPDIIVARSLQSMDKRRKDRFALFCNVHADDVVSAPDTDNIYRVPLMLHKQKIDDRILDKFGLKKRKDSLDLWQSLVDRIDMAKRDGKEIVVGIVGKYFSTGEYQLRDSYAALFSALEHAAWKNDAIVRTKWIDSEKLNEQNVSQKFAGLSGIIVPIGWGERGVEGMITAARFALKEKIPYLGLCYGMQLAAVAFARTVLGWSDANTTEVDPKTNHPIVHIIAAQKELMKRRAYGGTMRLGSWEALVKKGTIAWSAYDKNNAFIDKSRGLTSERHRHRFEFNSAYISDFEKAGMVISARSVVEGLVEIVEMPRSKHPFFLGTQGHPEYKSRPIKPHPLFLEYIEACLNISKAKL